MTDRVKKNRLHQVQVNGVDFVGQPATGRRFAIVKNLLGKRTEPTLRGLLAKKVTAIGGTEADAVEQLAKEIGVPSPTMRMFMDGSIVVPSEPVLVGLARALNMSIQELRKLTGAVEKGAGPVDLKELLAKAQKGESVTMEDVLATVPKDAIAKHLGVELPKPDPEPKGLPDDLKKSLPDAVLAYIEKQDERLAKMDETVTALKKERDDGVTASLRERAEQIKKSWKPDFDIEKATPEQVAAEESAMQTFAKHLEKAGITKAFGTTVGTEAAGTYKQAVENEVRNRLGREPFSKAEEQQVRKQIYADHPGLLSAITREERDQRTN